MPLDFDDLTEVDGPTEAEVRDYRLTTHEEADEESDVHPAAATLKDFATDVAAKQSADSAERYYRGVKALVAFLDLERGIGDPVEVEEADVHDYLKWIANTKWSRNTRQSRFTACQRFYRWAAEDGPHDANRAVDASIDDYTLEAGALEESRRETAEDDSYKWITREEVRRLWQPEHIESPRSRNELLLKLMWYTTCRTAALAGARLGDDLDREEGRLRVRNLKPGDNQSDYRWVYYPRKRIEPLLQEWLDGGRRDALGPYGKESDYLFLTRQKPKMRPSHISRIVKECAFNVNEKANSPEEELQEVSGYDVHGNARWLVTGHTVRHSAATWYANECPSVDIHFLKQQMGHSKLETTMRYVHEDEQARKRAFQRAWE